MGGPDTCVRKHNEGKCLRDKARKLATLVAINPVFNEAIEDLACDILRMTNYE